ncbi:hypothetical protein C7999DRAFT_28356 [Corynascus novoguineensis]|uniref:Uncharacterized protein n=1 Tax=Corynascus novoguineensis TaxID=1126955 RepID=A0AAN7CZ39_9PEZI|nr:hypothetical protein C7999DRAFT_28356 [Corynascus novoguineensis]
MSRLQIISAMNWVEHIRSLYAFEPIAAARVHWICKSWFKGMLFGNAMGAGKTLMGILAMYLVKDDPASPW